ncbi:helix-turn-helix transcriptional regulator [Plantactinospora sp. S1510]|uniref:Helix-turn-helix transcriptional regulator n=1 Tax=Plantactinospora alkalitolerans TaxID=2789879 RepID=A0ABS0H8W2_9ACTN|nr:helix-turn-helix transcriptional regulator [Plantactinospora alkalitolerans]MBF9134914.1 helix-turn-helix transcriptional regulator [Plantactinospora alkalitolerans]
MTEADLAGIVGVDAKTVSRWVSPGRMPHPRHRHAVAAALEVDVDNIWPEAVRSTVKTGYDREIVSVYPHRSFIPRTLWRDLIAHAGHDLVLAGYTSYFLWLDLPGLQNTLRRRAEAGARVRFLVGDPDSAITTDRERIEGVPLTVSTRIQVTLDQLGKLRDLAPRVQGRFSDRHIALSVFRFDNDMLVCTHLEDQMGHDSPTWHLRRRQDGGLWDRYAAHVEHLWDIGRDVWPSEETQQRGLAS